MARAVRPVTRVLLCWYDAVAADDGAVELGAGAGDDRVIVTTVVTVPAPVSPPEEHPAVADIATAIPSAAAAADRARVMRQG
ncbi:hypothetical protein GCM10009722_27050 [Williamsia deligens]